MTLSRQHLPDRRAVEPEEVRSLCPLCGDTAVPLHLHAHGDLPQHDLLTVCHDLFRSANGPQVRQAVDPRLAGHQ